MQTLKGIEIPNWVAAQNLSFFNTAQETKPLASHVKDDPKKGNENKV